MQTGFYCVVQFQPDRFRREGVNVGVIVVAERDREIRLRFAETNERVRRMFPGLLVDDQRLAAATRAFQRRILEVERTEEGVRSFIKRESSQIVVLPPLRVSIDDVEATLDRIFKELVEGPLAVLRVTCPRCSFSFDPATSTAGPQVAPAQVLTSVPLRPLRSDIARVLQPPIVAERRGDAGLVGWYAAHGPGLRSRDATSVLRMVESLPRYPLPFLAVPRDGPELSNVLPNKERWS